MSQKHDWEDPQAVFKQAIKEAYTLLTRCDDPLWVAANDATKKQLVRLIAENRMVSLGYVPSSWTYRAVCRVCGVVPLEGPVDGELVGCPWCASGAQPTVFSFV